MSEENKDIQEEGFEALKVGLETTLHRLGSTLPEDIDGASTKGLRRALKTLVEYMYTRQPSLDFNSLTKREARFIGELITLHETATQYTIQTIAEIQKEQQTQEENNG